MHLPQSALKTFLVAGLCASFSGAPIAAQTPETVQPGVGITGSSDHIALLKETLGAKSDQFAPGVRIKGPVTVTVARPDGTTKRYVGARDILYFAAPTSLSKTKRLTTFEGAVVFTTANAAKDKPKIEQGVVTVREISPDDI